MTAAATTMLRTQEDWYASFFRSIPASAANLVLHDLQGRCVWDNGNNNQTSHGDQQQQPHEEEEGKNIGSGTATTLEFPLRDGSGQVIGSCKFTTRSNSGSGNDTAGASSESAEPTPLCSSSCRPLQEHTETDDGGVHERKNQEQQQNEEDNPCTVCNSNNLHHDMIQKIQTAVAINDVVVDDGHCCNKERYIPPSNLLLAAT